MSTTPPDTTTPLVIGPQPQTPNLDSLGVLSDLVGTWNSPRGAEATGFNVMPLPQATAPNGYILKNFFYYEELTFAPIAGNAPNRGGTYTQQANVLFYEQRVFFADNPQPPPASQVQDALVHAENGAFLHLTSVQQVSGAYGPGVIFPNQTPPPQNPATAYVKQVSVPHGNSILAVGTAATITPTTTIVYPRANPTMLPFSAGGVTDPSDKLEQQLTAAIAAHGPVQSGWVLTLSSRVPGGGVDNIVFEQRHATVTSFDTSFFLLNYKDGFQTLQYSQIMAMMLLINNTLTPFLHVDANTMTRVLDS